MPAEYLFCPSVRRQGGRYDGKVTIVSALPCCGLDRPPPSLLDLKEPSTHTVGLKTSRMSALAGVVCCEKDECQAERRTACHSDSFQFYLRKRIAYWQCRGCHLKHRYRNNTEWTVLETNSTGLKKGFWDHVKIQDSLPWYVTCYKHNQDTGRFSCVHLFPSLNLLECDNTTDTVVCFQHNST